MGTRAMIIKKLLNENLEVEYYPKVKDYALSIAYHNDEIFLTEDESKKLFNFLYKVYAAGGPDMYDPEFGDDRKCTCSHPYYRHYDSYEDMAAVGCKYCPCSTFKEPE